MVTAVVGVFMLFQFMWVCLCCLSWLTWVCADVGMFMLIRLNRAVAQSVYTTYTHKVCLEYYICEVYMIVVVCVCVCLCVCVSVCVCTRAWALAEGLIVNAFDSTGDIRCWPFILLLKKH